MFIRSRFKRDNLHIPPGGLCTPRYLTRNQGIEYVAIGGEERKTFSIHAVLLARSHDLQPCQDARDHRVEIEQEMSLRTRRNSRDAGRLCRFYTGRNKLNVLHESVS